METNEKSILTKTLLVAAFFGVLGASNLVLLDRVGNSYRSAEKRELTKFPALTGMGTPAFTRDFEAFFQDNSPFRNALVYTGTGIKYYLFQDSPSSQVIVGKDGWLFYSPKGGATMRDFVGQPLLSEESLKDIATKMGALATFMAQRKGDFAVYISPNKSRIYPEQMSDAYGPMSSENSSYQLRRYLAQNTPEVKFLYRPEDFNDAKKNGMLLYQKGDSHWNGLGAYVAFNRIMSTLDPGFLPLAEPVIEGTPLSGSDLADLMPLAHYEGGQYYRVVNFHPDIITTNVEMIDNGNSLWRLKSSNKNGKKLMIYGDSFTPSLLDYIAKEYEDTVVVNRNYKDLTPDLVVAENPTILLIHRVERAVPAFPTELSVWGRPGGPLVTSPYAYGLQRFSSGTGSHKLTVSSEYGLAPFINWYKDLKTNWVLYIQDSEGAHPVWKNTIREGKRYTMKVELDTTPYKGDVTVYFLHEFENGLPTKWTDVTTTDLLITAQ